jgi:hypothetical protein
MAHFFVGQRVRVKAARTREAAEFVGCETRIIGSEFTDGEDHWVLALKSAALPQATVICAKFSASQYLEPILPDGHQACDDDFKRDLDRLLERQGIAA